MIPSLDLEFAILGKASQGGNEVDGCRGRGVSTVIRRFHTVVPRRPLCAFPSLSIQAGNVFSLFAISTGWPKLSVVALPTLPIPRLESELQGFLVQTE